MIADLLARPVWVVLVPIVATVGLALLRRPAAARWLNLAATALTAGLACRLPWQQGADGLLLIDPLTAHMTILTAWVGLAAAWFDLASPSDELSPATQRLCHALFQVVLGGLLLASLSNDVGLAWAAIAVASLAAAAAVGLGGSDAAVTASRQALLVCGLGAALALFGAVVLALAAAPVLGPGLAGMTWTGLAAASPQMPAGLLGLAFVFLLLGFGTLAALVPLHGWLPDAQAEAPPLAALLGGAIPGVGLVLILRLRGLLATDPQAIAPGPPLVILGIASVLLAGVGLWRAVDARRALALAGIGQTGLAAVAIGLGGAGATLAAMLHLTLLTLARTAAFTCLGHAARRSGSHRLGDIPGLIAFDAKLGLTLAAALAALAGLPPFGLFASTVLIVGETMRRIPWLLPPLGLGLVAGAWALVAGAGSFGARSDRGAGPLPHGPTVQWAAIFPAWLALALVVLLGLAMPAAVAAWFAAVAGTVP